MQKVKLISLSTLLFAVTSTGLAFSLPYLIVKLLLIILGIKDINELELGIIWVYLLSMGSVILGWLLGLGISLFVSIKLTKRFKLKWYWGLISLAVYIALFGMVLFFLPSVRPVKAEVIPSLQVQHNQLTFGSWSASSSSSSNPDLKKQIIEQAVTAIQNQDAKTLYSLMASDFTGVFTEENLASSLLGGEKIVNITYLETPQTLPEGWAEQRATFKTESGIEKTFNLILKLEDSDWRLAATEEVVK